MSDAAEVLSVIYERLGKASGGAERISRLFEWHVYQYVFCPACNRFSHETLHRQWFFCTSTTALRGEAMRCSLDSQASMELGVLLSRIEMQLQKSCDIDLGKSNSPGPEIWTTKTLPSCVKHNKCAKNCPTMQMLFTGPDVCPHTSGCLHLLGLAWLVGWSSWVGMVHLFAVFYI